MKNFFTFKSLIKISSWLVAAVLILSACSSAAPTSLAIDLNQAQTQAVATIYAGITQTAFTLIPVVPSATPDPTRDPNRTPPALPAGFTTNLLNPLDTPHTYIQDQCEVLNKKWNEENAVPGTILVPIMFHSITKGDATADNAITNDEFKRIMNDLHEMGFEAVSMQQAADFLYNNSKIPKRSVLLIVDDRKYREYFDTTFKKYYKDWGWVVVNSWINLDDSIYTQVIGENIALEKEGWVDHQSHGTVHNIPMSNDSTDEYLKGELLGSMEKMRNDYGKTPIAFIWPGGGFAERPVAAAQQYGYKLAFTINPRGPLMFNWIPLADQGDDMRPSYIPEGQIGNPLFTLPRYWDTDIRDHLDDIRNIGDEAEKFALANKDTELLYYDIACAAEFGALQP